MKLIALAVGCVALTALTSCSQSAPTNQAAPTAVASPQAVKAATPDALAAARGNYAKNCVACHGETGEGGLVKVEDKKLKVPSFKTDNAKKHPDSDFTKQISNGGDGMPAFKAKLSTADIADLVKFVRSEFQGK